MRINAQPRDVHPEGTFTFTWRQFREGGQRSYTPRDSDEPVTTTVVRAGLQSESGAYVWDGFDLDGPMSWRLSAAAEATFGRRFKKGETFDTDDLVDKQVVATVVHNEGAQGTFTNLRDFAPAAGAAAAPRPAGKVMPLAAKTKPTLKPFPGGRKTTKR